MSKHTPGPWKCAPVKDEDGNPMFIEITADGIKEIANTANGNFSDEVEHSNARLIAAAPDLLALVKDCFDYLSSVEDGVPPGGPSVERFEMVIKKAEGA